MFCRKCGMLNDDNDSKCSRCEEVLNQVAVVGMYRQSTEIKPEGATNVLVFGILGWAVCGVFGIVAWVLGNSYLERCRQAGVEPETIAVVGRILGMVQTIFMGVMVLVFILLIAFIGLAAG